MADSVKPLDNNSEITYTCVAKITDANGVIAYIPFQAFPLEVEVLTVVGLKTYHVNLHFCRDSEAVRSATMT